MVLYVLLSFGGFIVESSKIHETEELLLKVIKDNIKYLEGYHLDLDAVTRLGMLSVMLSRLEK